MDFVGQPNTLLQYTRLNSSELQTVGAVKYFMTEKNFLTAILHCRCLRMFNQGSLFRNM